MLPSVRIKQVKQYFHSQVYILYSSHSNNGFRAYGTVLTLQNLRIAGSTFSLVYDLTAPSSLEKKKLICLVNISSTPF